MEAGREWGREAGREGGRQDGREGMYTRCGKIKITHAHVNHGLMFSTILLV